ncbi:MAG: patatin-like phospholipase family protein [Polaribacter sp.]|nr:patatin-like phospholipase family protein [Polaribacter sp.]
MMKKLLFFLLLSSVTLFAQIKQPKVGLVLSGGGAKGFAHIGVLKAIDSAGIQVDYIGGTSMGAIIGGLYAAGYNANQIEKIMLDTDFFKVLKDVNPRRSKAFFDKEYGEKNTLVLPVYEGEIGLPKGVSKGQNVLNYLTYLLSSVDTIRDFSKLPIPFFCIATDVETGAQVKLTKGYLPLALRASSSFPTILTPVEAEGKLLIDGGIANNFPIDEMKKTGADIIIGVDVQGKLFKKEKIKSVLDVLSQITSYQMYQKSPAQIADTDVYIHPDISMYSVVSFDKASQIVEKGKEASLPFLAIFDSISALQIQKKKHLKKNTELSRFLVNEIEVKGGKNYTKTYVLGVLKLRVGDSISYEEMSKKMNYLTSTGSFQRVDFIFEKNATGRKLVITTRESDEKAELRLGVHYDLVYKSALLINYNHKNILLKNDVLSVDLIIGDKPRYNLNYFIDNGFYYSFGFSSRYNRFGAGISFNEEGINELDLNYVDFTNSIHIQTTFDRKFAFGIGLEHKKIVAKTNTISTGSEDPFFFDKSDYINGISYLKLDTYDHKYFPKKGVQIDANFRWYLWSSNYNKNFVQFSQISGKIGVVKTVFENFTMEYISEAGFTLGMVGAKYFDFHLGGYNQNLINTFVSFYGYDIGALSEQSFVKSTFYFRYQVFRNQYVSFLGNYARVKESVLKNGVLFDDTKSGYALGYSVNTLIGPIELKHSWSPDTKNHYWYFNLGFWF